MAASLGVAERDTPLIEFDICHRMPPLRMLYYVTLTSFFKVTIRNVNISEMGENGESRRKNA